jgi:acetyl-CoA acetyltransferase
MYRFGLTNEDFGRYSVVARKHAATNPAAYFYGRPITLEDHQNSRWIVEPILRLLDCCQTNDGAVALIVTTPERAADLAGQSVIVEATSQSHLRDGDELHDYYLGDRTEFAEATSLGRRLYEAAGLTPDDIDTAMIYENFSPLVFLVLEAYGFCGPGEAVGFVADGSLDIDGALPTNTHGGLLGEAYIHGINSIQEGVRQVRGTAVNQVADVDHCLVSSLNSGLVLGKR